MCWDIIFYFPKDSLSAKVTPEQVFNKKQTPGFVHPDLLCNNELIRQNGRVIGQVEIKQSR